MAKKTISVDGVEYVRADSLASIPPKDSKIKIVILQRGWVMIGYYSELENDMCQLDNAQVIRRWGTTDGLGQLAREGKQTDTKLEPTGKVNFHKLTVVATIDCDEIKWTSL
jgi:hypothetical protein